MVGTARTWAQPALSATGRRWRRRSSRSPKVATSTRDHPHRAPDGIRWPPTIIRIALALLAVGVLVFTVTSIFYPNASHNVFFADYCTRRLNSTGGRADRRSRIPRHGRPFGLVSDRGRHGIVGDGRRRLRRVGARRPVPLAGRSGIPGVLSVRLRRAAPADAGTPAAGARLPIRLDSLVCGLAVAAVGAALAAGPIHAAAARAPATVLVGLVYPGAT